MLGLPESISRYSGPSELMPDAWVTPRSNIWGLFFSRFYLCGHCGGMGGADGVTKPKQVLTCRRRKRRFPENIRVAIPFSL